MYESWNALAILGWLRYNKIVMERTRGKSKQGRYLVETSIGDAVTTDVLTDIVERLVATSAPEQIVLFGSRARGTARPDSDVDLLVIADSDEPRHKRAVSMYGALRDIYVPMDIVVYTADEVKSWSNVPQAFVTTACREGKVLYEKH